MSQLPDGRPTYVGQPTDRTEVRKLANAVEEALAEEMRTSVRLESPDVPSWQDGPRIGSTPPVAQPDSRIVPAWAAGIAVASIGVGAGITGIGCGVWLVLQGLSTVTLNGVLMVTLPFAGLAMAATAIGGAINKARAVKTTTINNFNGPVDQRSVRSKSVGVWVKNNNQP
ncbi:hypothetical protein ACFWDI_28275 [Streptomyces sp. NPDC060064]|uniref:hypothetical protein n=1 Tax=Streptomyces sp. NPDC060064 TaxID=3347049 RepID=UPI0036A1B91D